MTIDKRRPFSKGSSRGRRRGRAAVPLYEFDPPVGTPYGLEVNTIEDFFAKHDPWPWDTSRPGRATFHYLILVTEGELLHDVDHVTQTVAPGQWLWVRPGHAQCWHPPSAARGPFIHVAEYARLLGCSIRTLSRATRDATGKGAREVIDERRLLEARRLLGVAGWDARAVATHLGFTDPGNFGRFFRARTGLTSAAFAAGAVSEADSGR
ncbi:helix-turn-helix domain-containing protein [Promicromonospora alba]|uniref:Helix-turn-helix domain-containing protein n=1 Tax=Promicromonospora alba TaxID=1616110 RepID=A0ABV9HNP1_9MICO